MAKIELKDMRLTPREKKEMRDTALAPEVDNFPFGLRLHLNEESIKNLGIDKLPAPGTDGMIMAKVRVESASVRKDNEKTERDLTIQITKMGFSTDTSKLAEETTSGDGPPKASASEVLFGD